MPSSAFEKFEGNLIVDVQRIIASHGQLNHEGYGRRGLGHITRSGVLMLCAAWEFYLEELLIASAKEFINRVESPKDLPMDVQKEISQTVKNSKHELKPLELAGDGWSSMYINHVHESVDKLNTPKSTNVDPLYRRLLGVQNLSNIWTLGERTINAFVAARGDIAHKGSAARYIGISQLQNYKLQIEQTILETDNFMADYIQSTLGGRSPWRRRSI